VNSGADAAGSPGATCAVSFLVSDMNPFDFADRRFNRSLSAFAGVF
jgi:hypothetical protein